ncbi:O-methyltransferase [Nitrosospira sp. Nsp1]|uniref:O-methyltransferase n=1 Tax=Nitrosospira sp. Nsp1 TaxID=136547 RepID=UPI000881EE9A|nr:class I SAM-dependent methyltransferase [Nitrosospira sp. Nsp1]SCX49222.1 Predicted O-methyltransferase YrrM [Nitrosospira sp. Nsp1]
MGLRNLVASIIDTAVDRAYFCLRPKLVVQKDTDILLHWLSQWVEVREYKYPALYLEFMRRWTEDSACVVQQIKGTPSGRYALLLDQLASHVPVAPINLANEAAKIADAIADRREIFNFGDWSADVGLHFQISSSLGRKGRLLCAATRLLRPAKCLEIGTAYGMSGFFIAKTLDSLGGGSLSTIEIGPQQQAIAQETLAGLPVDFCLGSSTECLSKLSAKGAEFDFVFHDAGHSYSHYVSDFEAMVKMLKPGTVLIMDDIRWEDSRFFEGGARTYEGWRKVVEHPRVVAAADVDDAYGIALLS